MKTENQNPQNSNRPQGNAKPQQVNEPGKDKNTSNKKPVYVKDMPPIDGAKSGII